MVICHLIVQDAKVTAHLVQNPGEPDRTVFLIKFSAEVCAGLHGICLRQAGFLC